MTATVDGDRRGLVWRALAILPITAVGAWLAFSLAVSGVTRKRDPQTALKFVPMEATALAGRADQLLFAALKAPSREVRALAVEALRQQAINPPALRALGYYASAHGQEPLARQYIRLAAHQSPRDSAAQFWLIQDAVMRGDVNEALQHYDIALRTRPATQNLLFPILLGAIDEPAIRKALTPYIRTDRLWVQTFMGYANNTSTNLPALVALVVESGGLGNPTAAQGLNLELLTRLVANKQFSEARRLYEAMPGARAELLVDLGFHESDRDGRFGPMGWQIMNNPESGGSFTLDGRGTTALSVFASPATTTRIASRLLYLQPGLYDFAARLTGAPSGDASSIRWQMRCPKLSDRPIWTMVSRTAQSGGQVTVPADCTEQYVDIVVSGGDGQSGLEASILDVSARRR